MRICGKIGRSVLYFKVGVNTHMHWCAKEREVNRGAIKLESYAHTNQLGLVRIMVYVAEKETLNPLH